MEYAILGGGALGLMSAYRLTQAGHSVMVFEQEKIAGGLAAGFHVAMTARLGLNGWKSTTTTCSVPIKQPLVSFKSLALVTA